MQHAGLPSNETITMAKQEKGAVITMLSISHIHAELKLPCNSSQKIRFIPFELIVSLDVGT